MQQNTTTENEIEKNGEVIFDQDRIEENQWESLLDENCDDISGN